MSPVAYVAPAVPQIDFRVGTNPSVIQRDFSNNYSNTTFRFLWQYTVPNGRRAIVEYVNVILTADGTIIPAGTVSVVSNYIISGGPNTSTSFIFMRSGDGPGRIAKLSLWGGTQMLPGDTWQSFLSSTNCGITGLVRTTFRAIEYDVTDPCAENPCAPAGGGGGG